MPAEERYHDYSWEGLQKEFKADFPNFDLRIVELDLGEFIRVMHLVYPQDAHLVDVAFIDSYGDLGPLLKENAVVRMWGQSRLQYRGWWVVFRQARNFAAGESFLLWASQRPHWTPWSVSTRSISPADVTAVQKLSQRAVQDFTNEDAQSLESIMDPDAAHFPAFGTDGVQTLSIEPLLTFGNSRLAFVLLAAVGEGDKTFGMAHFGVILRKTGAVWKVWLFLPAQPLPDLEHLLQSFDDLGLKETGAQTVPKVTLLTPAGPAQPSPSSPPDVEWSTVDTPLATYVVESQISQAEKDSWTPSRLEFVSPISVGPSVRTKAPLVAGEQPRRWRVWAISKAGIVSTSDWRVIDANPPRFAQKVSTPEVPVAAMEPACMEWVDAAERGQPMVPPSITVRYNPRAPGARLASPQSLTLVVAQPFTAGCESMKIPMTRAADGSWQAEFTPKPGSFIPSYAIFFFEDEKNAIDNHGGRFWDILGCSHGVPDEFAVQAQASTYDGRMLAPGIQRAPSLARAMNILKGDLARHPRRIYENVVIWTYELKLGADSPSAYEQVGSEVDAFITDHANEKIALLQLGGFIGPHQQKLPSSVVQRFRQVVAQLPGADDANRINSGLDYWLLSSEVDLQKRAQGYLAFAAKYPQSAIDAYKEALNCEVELKDVAGAESVFEKLAALDRESLEPWFTMAQLYIDQQTKADRAVKLLDTADTILLRDRKRYVGSAFGWEQQRIQFLRGQAYVLLNDLAHARADFEAAAQATPDDPKVLYALGEVRERMRDMVPALEAYLAAASAPYQVSPAARDAYQRLFVAQNLGTTRDAEQRILDRVAENSNRAAAQYTPIAMNRPAPEFAFVDLAGKRFDNHDAKGKPAILTFWGVWCAACVTELPALQEFQKRHPGANLLAVEIGNTPQEVKSFLSSHNLDALRVAVRQDMPLEFGLSAYPNTLVIDRFGQIQFVHAGLLSNFGAILGKDLEAFPTPE